jgi:hypothetical protein
VAGLARGNAYVRSRIEGRLLEQGRFVFEDVLGEKLKAEQKLACRGIVLDGRWWHG